MKFEVGDRVVYPNQGVAFIRDLVTRRIGGIKGHYFVLELEALNSTVMVPQENIGEIGLRRLSTKKELEKLFKALRREDYEVDSDWKRRYKNNLEKVQGGTLEEIGEVIKALHCFGREKNLGLRDQKIMDSARQLVISEIAAVRDISDEEAEEILDSFLQDEK